MNTCRIFLFLSIICTFSVPVHGTNWFLSTAAKETERQAYNDHNLAELKKLLETKPQTTFALISDLHDVLFDRLPGDLGRGWQLAKNQPLIMCSFLGHLAPFGSTYLAYKMGLAHHPNLEYHAIDLGEKEPNKELLQLISPFTLNKDMAELYKSCKYPIFACSNIGQQSYDFLNGQFNFDKLFKGKQIATPENGYLQKDCPETYQALHATMIAKMGKAPEALLMIDNRKTNLESCKAALAKELPSTIYGFIFTNYADLDKALKKHGLDTLFKKQDIQITCLLPNIVAG